MTIVDVTYTRHSACGCAFYPDGSQVSTAAVEQVPIVRGIERAEIIDRIRIMRRMEESDAYRISDYLAPTPASAPAPSTLDADEDSVGPDCGGGGDGDGMSIDIDRECRAKMAEWFYQLADFCRVDRDNVAVAMSYLDRFLSTAVRRARQSSPKTYARCHPKDDDDVARCRSGTSIARARRCVSDRQEYQLAAMSCLHLAVNMSETREMDTSLLVELSHGKYARSDFVSMAEAVTFGLGWRLNGPTAMAFVNHFLGLLPPLSDVDGDSEMDEIAAAVASVSVSAPAKSKQLRRKAKAGVSRHSCCRRASSDRALAALHDLCRAQVELAVSDYRLAGTKPSDVAIAALRNALEDSSLSASLLSASSSYRSLLAFLRSLDVAVDVRLHSPQVERARAILKAAYESNVDGLRQVTSLLTLGGSEHEQGDVAVAHGRSSHHPDDDDDHSHCSYSKQAGVNNVDRSASERCVGQVEHFQHHNRFRSVIGEGATP